MNLSILVSSFKYLQVFNLVVTLNSWIYSELSRIYYDDAKLINLFYTREIEIIKSIIHLKTSKDLSKLLNISFSIFIFYRNDEVLYQKIKILIDAGFDVKSEKHILMRVILLHDTRLVMLILQTGVDVNIKNNEALTYASENKLTEIVKLLIEFGIDIHAYDNRSLIYASSNGSIDIVKLLLQAGADVHIDDDEALARACFYGHYDIVKLLLESGTYTSYSRSLRCASYAGHLEIVKLLLEKKVYVPQEALDNAIKRSHTEVVKLLQDYDSRKRSNQSKRSKLRKFIRYAKKKLN